MTDYASRCRECGSPAPSDRLASSGTPGVYWTPCDECWSKLSDDAKRAVEEERKKPFAF